ncbi:MAG: tetratricopeptide repeat protein [Polyangiaceae bacterium]|nr:tetratricopeptide repeat protein [Polyangiaceae bacterium]
MTTAESLHLAVEKDPAQPKRWLELGLGLLEAAEAAGPLREDPEATAAIAASLLHALSLQPESAELRLKIARGLESVGCFQRALEGVDSAVAVDAKLPGAMELRAKLLLDLSQPDRAIKVLKQMDGSDETPGSAQFLFAQAYQQLGSYEPALQHAQLAVAGAPRSVPRLYLRAELYGKLKKSSSCVSAWEEIIKLTNQAPKAVRSLADAYLAAGQAGRAVEVLREFVSTSPDSADAQLSLSIALIDAGKPAEAVKSAEIACRLRPRSPEAAMALADALGPGGDAGRAIKAFQRALELEPESAGAWHRLSGLLSKSGDEKGATSALLRAASLAPDDGQITDALNDSLAPPPVTGAGPENAFRGSLEDFPVGETLDLLKNKMATGRLRIETPLGTAMLTIARGRVATAALEGERGLAQSLLDDREVLKMALVRALGTGWEELADDDVVTELIDKKVVTEKQLTRTLRQQVRRVLAQIVDARSGQFIFDKAEVSDTALSLSVDSTALILDIYREMDEAKERGL